MADPQELHQIEYRHHRTKDLSPVASSMPSADSQRKWDGQIRPWVRHPHADSLSESACYQLFPNGQAAVAWRYWDERAAERADGTRGRPLVSRVLVGQASVLTPEVSVALCRVGPTAYLVGVPPGEVPDGSTLPTVSSATLDALTGDTTPVLDDEAARQPGLQAVVAAAMADPSTPLGISLDEDLIQRPLRQSAQCLLLWGLRRIVWPLFGPVGRNWSFSTYELPMGETDPVSLPAIVFRQTQDRVQAPPARWRKEVKVRPLALDALDPAVPYGEFVQLAGALVAEYRDRGGDELALLITECCGSERSTHARLERVRDWLPRTQTPAKASVQPAQAEHLPPGEMAEVSVAERHEPVVPGLATPEQALPEQPLPEPEQAEQGSICAQVSSTTAPGGGVVEAEPTWEKPGGVAHERARALGSSREGQMPPQLPLPGPGVPAGASGPRYTWEPNRQARTPVTVSYLLKQLELVGDDQDQFQLILRDIFQFGTGADDPNDRAKSWEVISSNDWFDNICKHHELYPQELAGIFGMIVMPEIDGPGVAEVIGRWALEARSPMIGGLLAAAHEAGPEAWQSMMSILEPVLAFRWARDNLVADHWDGGWTLRPVAGPGRGDAKGGIFGRFRRR